MDQFSKADIDNRFDYHPSNSASNVAAHTAIRQLAKQFAQALTFNVPKGRELATALSHVEDALMWGNAGIARVDDNGNRIGDEPAVI